jgi:hypothetical protein
MPYTSKQIHAIYYRTDGSFTEFKSDCLIV